MKKVVVIGAGIGGMAVANMFAKAGYDVTVYEKRNTVGGRAGELRADGFTFDTGPSWYLMPEVYEHYFSLLGESSKDYYDLRRMSPAYKVFFEDTQSVTVAGDLKKDAPLFESLEKGSGEKLVQHVAQAKKIYTLALENFLYNPFRDIRTFMAKDIILNSWLLMTQLLKPIHSLVSHSFASRKLQQILEYHMVFLGASPFNAPALYQLMSYLDFDQGVFYPKGGMYEVVKALKKQGDALGVKYVLNADVASIVVRDGVACGVQLGKKVYTFDTVISNSDLHYTETQLLPEKSRSYTEKYWKKREAGPSALLMYLGVEGSLDTIEHHNLFFVDDWKKNFDAIYSAKEWPDKASIYLSKTSKSDTTAPKGHEAIFVLVPLPASLKKYDKNTTDAFSEKCLKQIERMTAINDLRKRIVYKKILTPDYFGEEFYSWQNTALGMAHTLKQSAFFRPSVKSKKVKNLYYVGAGAQPGIGVPMCLISAELVYKHSINDTSAGPLRGVIGKDL